MSHDVIIVGAGLSGLCCALRLQQAGVNCSVLEASDGVGGRIRTDVVDGFLLDRGFQVFLTSYPEAQQVLDFPSLQLKAFQPGALVRHAGSFHELTDPWRRPWAAIRSLFTPIGTWTDKLRVAQFRNQAMRGTLEDQLARPETTSLQALKSVGFSESMIDRFFRPFLGGIFLDADLTTSSRMLYFVFRMFSSGTACLPAAGMEAIPLQIADRLQPGTLQLNSPVAMVEPLKVRLSSGQELETQAVVVASDGPSAAKLLGTSEPVSGQGVTCLYFAASKPPVDRPILLLNGEGRGPINNLCVPTTVTSNYGPAGQSLISVTVLQNPTDANLLMADVLDQLRDWFGTQVDTWRHLKTYSIPYALPSQPSQALNEPERSVRWKPGLYVCGDHRDNASIQGAMTSGRRAAEAVLEDLA